ncbi:MAG TPA: hypothetical protein VI248_03250 [Kineosporiaceae bacterium]
MAVAVDGGFEQRPEGRRLAAGRLASGLGPRVRRYLDPAWAPDEQVRCEETERVLRAAVEALLELAHRTPGIDLTVSVGPGNGPAVRLHYTNEGLVADRLTSRGRPASREGVAPVFSESEVVSELASMLWAGEVETR